MTNSKRMSDEPMAIQACISSNFFISFFLYGWLVGEKVDMKKRKVAAKKEIQLGFGHSLLSTRKCNHKTNVIKHMPRYLIVKLSRDAFAMWKFLIHVQEFFKNTLLSRIFLLFI